MYVTTKDQRGSQSGRHRFASHAVRMLSKGSVENTSAVVPWVLVWLMVAHAIISVAFAFLGHKGAQNGVYRSYANMNVTTNIQRMSGILLLVFTALHVLGTTGLLQPPQVVHAILPPLFFTVALMHTAISTSKAFITLGIGNARFIKAADVVIKALCGAILIADVAGFYLFSV